jgi:hypothetical protein
MVQHGVQLSDEVHGDVSRSARWGIKPFGTKSDDPRVRRILFDRQLLMHATNSIDAIVNEIHSAKTDISLRRISTSRVENRFGVTRMHADV